MSYQLISSLNAGELSPYLDARSDLEKYTAGCRVLENFILLPYGGAFRRPGTEYLGKAKYADKQCRLIGFNFSTNTGFVLELGLNYMRFWSNKVRVDIDSDPDSGVVLPWLPATGYEPGNYVTTDAEDPGNPTPYYCLTEHLSGDDSSFLNALAAGFWVKQTALEVVTPYLDAELRDVQYMQINDVMYFTHPKHPPQKLSRLADNHWTFDEVAWGYPALLDENSTSITIAAGAKTGSTTLVAATGTAVWVTGHDYKKGDFFTDAVGHLVYEVTKDYTSGADVATDLGNQMVKIKEIFNKDQVGGYFGLAYIREDNNSFVDVALIHPSANSDPLDVLGDWELTTYGSWQGTLSLQRSTDKGATWDTLNTWESADVGERNVSSKGSQENEAQMRLAWTYSSAGTSAIKPNARLEVADNKLYGIVKITGVTDEAHATCEVVKDLLFAGSDTAAPTKYWAEGAWSNLRGFPRTVTLFQQRVFYAGNDYRPESIWGSKVDDFENFFFGTNDDTGLFFSLSSTESNKIQWMVAQTELLVGTTGDEWTLGSTDQGGALTPSNVKAVRQSSYGSKFLPALVVNDVILFVQRAGRKLRELVYSFEKSGWIATDLTVLAEHVTKGQILECAYQQQPDAIYWAITGEGQLIGMTYERAQNVVGWHRHTTDGIFESVATINGDDTVTQGNDQVWVSVQRKVGGQTVRYIECMNSGFRQAFEDEDRLNWWYLDCARRTAAISPASTSLPMPNLNHLEGRTVDVLADGAVAPSCLVTGGNITLQSPAGDVLAGLPYTSQLKPMKLEMQLQDGASRGRMKRIHRLTVSLLKSLNGQFSSNGTDWDSLYFRQMSDPMDAGAPVFTGDKLVDVAANHARSADITLRQTQPLPLTILALVVEMDTYGD